MPTCRGPKGIFIKEPSMILPTCLGPSKRMVPGSSTSSFLFFLSLALVSPAISRARLWMS